VGNEKAEAVHLKLTAQREYVLWRDAQIAGAGRSMGGRPRNDYSSEIVLPDTDPGAVTIHRWRKRLCPVAGYACATMAADAAHAPHP
jgi:hypothetical protein